MERALVPLIVLFLVSLSLGAQIEVCPSCKVKSIKQALQIAKDGDTILVKGGLYREGGLIVDKSVKLIGDGMPTLDGEGKYEVLKVVADNVTVKGFRIINSGRSEIEDIAGLKVEDAKGCLIEGNVFENNFWAIYLANVENCRVVGNRIVGPGKGTAVSSGNGIHLWKCKNIEVVGNIVIKHRDGIYLEFAEDSLIKDNVVEENWRYGLHFMFSHRNSYIGNVFRRNGAGVAVMYTKRVLMKGNRFEHNWGSASYGLLLKAIDDSVVVNNIFLKNTAGILMDECQRTKVIENDFVENGWALRVWGNSWGNTIARNNFIANSFDVGTNTSINPNKIEGNYWSAYKGYDLDGDGFGDVPYRPVKLFSYIVENNPSAIVLLRSFFVQILNVVEDAIPVIVPLEVKDDKPRMRAVKWR